MWVPRLPLLLVALMSSSVPTSLGDIITASSFNFSSGTGSASLQEALKSLADGSLSTSDLKELTEQKYGQTTQQDPFEILDSLESMNKETQLAFLESFGETISQEAGLTCNIYGGKESCVQLSSDSEFARLCPDHDLKVDCAYSVMAAQEAQLNPVRDIKRALEAAKEQDIEADCPECFKNQLHWFCASLFPKCGSVRASTETQLLPIISEIVKVGSEGKDPGEALSSVLPMIMKARSLTLPCRQMCLDMMDTCACGERKTMGQLLETYSDAQTGEPLPAAFSMQLFEGVKNTSFCDLFSPASAPGFAGTCQTLQKQCSDREGWCQPGNPVPGVAAEIMAGQLADSLFGQMDSWNPDHSSAAVTTAAGTPKVEALEEKYLRDASGAPSASQGSTGKGILIGVSCTAVAAIAGLGAAFWWTSVRNRRSQENANYIAMTENDGLLSSTDQP